MTDQLASNDVLNTSAMLLVQEEALTETCNRLGAVLVSGLVAIGVRDPELRSRVILQMLPGMPGASKRVVTTQLNTMVKSSLITEKISSSVLKSVARIENAVSRIGARRSATTFIGGPYDYEGTLREKLVEGAIVCVLRLSGVEHEMPKALSGLPAGCWLSAVECSVRYRRKYFWDGFWSLGTIQNGSSVETRSKLDELSDRNVISAERVEAIGVWIDTLAMQSKILPILRIAAR